MTAAPPPAPGTDSETGPEVDSEIPEISVVIPHLNEADMLRRCLQSLADQRDAPPFEIIVVDNGSAVLPAALCAAAGVQLLQEPVPGPGPARNRGAAAGRAGIFAFADADCLTDPGWLAAIAASFRDPATQILGGDVRIAIEDPARLTTIEAYESIYGFRQQLYIARDRYVATGNMAVRRAAFEQVGPFGGIAIAEDMDWGRRASELGFPLTYVPAMRVYHPARRSFSELCRKWDRHVAHFYVENRHKPLWWPRWIARTCAVALSPLGEAVAILRSDRVAGWRARGQALAGVTRIRLYRAGRMLALGLGADPAALSGAWNRS